MIEKLCLISFWVFGFCCTFWEGMIFEKVGNWLEDKLPEWLQKPLYSCFICACFWWGTALYIVFWRNSFQEWFLVVIGAMGLNALLSKLFPNE